jgi:hypothetical protein
MLLISTIQMTDDLKALYIKTAQVLSGSDKRQFMAGVVKGLGVGGTNICRKRAWMESTDYS